MARRRTLVAGVVKTIVPRLSSASLSSVGKSPLCCCVHGRAAHSLCCSLHLSPVDALPLCIWLSPPWLAMELAGGGSAHMPPSHLSCGLDFVGDWGIDLGDFCARVSPGRKRGGYISHT